MEDMVDVRQATEVIGNTLDRLDHASAASMSDTQLLDAMTRMRHLAARMEAEAAVWTSAAALATQRATGTPLCDYLATTEARTSKEAQGVVHQAHRITADPQVARAALAGQVPPAKAAAIGRVLGELPADRMTGDQRRAAAAELINQAASSTTRQITGSGERILERVAPDLAPSPADRAALLERQRRRALNDRHLAFGAEQDGAVRFWGQLPTLEATQLRLAVQACVERGRRDESDQLKALREQRRTAELTDADYLAARTDLASRESRSTGQRQADAITDMARALNDLGQIPRSGGEPARLVITIDHHDLAQMARDAAATGRHPDGTPLDPDQLNNLRAGLAATAASSDATDNRWPTPVTGTLETGEQIPASALRLLCCQADLMPAVLGAQSQILDVGRTRRLVTTPIRQALRLRDGHCIFPGCTVPAAICQAHHVLPWWAGGQTRLDNLVSLCAHHHGVVEPDRFNTATDQWTITFDDHQIPHLTPPRRLARHLPTTEPQKQDSAPPPEGPTQERPGRSTVPEPRPLHHGQGSAPPQAGAERPLHPRQQDRPSPMHNQTSSPGRGHPALSTQPGQVRRHTDRADGSPIHGPQEDSAHRPRVDDDSPPQDALVI